MSRWNAISDGLLKRCARKGLSAAETARKLGRDFTRDMVLGRAGRLTPKVKFNGKGRYAEISAKSWETRRARYGQRGRP